MLLYPVNQLLCRADVVGNAFWPLFQGWLLGSRPALSLKRLKVEVQGDVDLQEERQPVTVG